MSFSPQGVTNVIIASRAFTPRNYWIIIKVRMLIESSAQNVIWHVRPMRLSPSIFAIATWRNVHTSVTNANMVRWPNGICKSINRECTAPNSQRTYAKSAITLASRWIKCESMREPSTATDQMFIAVTVVIVNTKMVHRYLGIWLSTMDSDCHRGIDDLLIKWIQTVFIAFKPLALKV